MSVEEAKARRFVRLGHVMPDARDTRLSNEYVDAWKCARCGVVLWVSVDESWLSAEKGCVR